MNIKQAKEEIRNAVRSYLKKDAEGNYEIPVEKQRPILLIGPPGIGKTAIMEQVAAECEINLVSYTITHHTRQSAIGLPFITERTYGGRPYSVTEYTMSEIVASVYEQIERSGIREGILFLDEINCVSETLAPTMLQFLQYKTFGTHRVPEGFLIVAAGNPPQYNRSVREFDIVTLDRVRRIDVEEDYSVWKEYARSIGIHGAILAYLEIRGEHFYSIRTELEGIRFVTARGWEDLSRTLVVYEEEGIPVTEALVGQYLQDGEVARGFAAYYALYRKYHALYRIPEILEGAVPEEAEKLAGAPFDEKLSILGLLLDALSREFRAYAEAAAVQGQLLELLRGVRGRMKEGTGAPEAVAGEEAACLDDLGRLVGARLISREEARVRKKAARALAACGEGAAWTGEAAADYRLLQERFAGREEERQREIERVQAHLTHAFSFITQVFGEGQELVIFLTELSGSYDAVRFLREVGNEAFERYDRLLLLNDRGRQLREQVRLGFAQD